MRQKGETGSISAILKHWTLPAGDSAWHMFGDCTCHNVGLKRHSRQNDSHRIRIVMQRNSWKGNIIFDAESVLKNKKSNAL